MRVVHVACAWVWVLGLPLLARAAEFPDFDTVIAPLLASRCLDCHSGSEPKGGLNLSQQKLALTGGESGSGVVAGNLDDSQLWQRVAAGEMPPKKPLPEAERALLKAWIERGARWGTDPIDPFRFSTSSRAGYDWWSLRPLAQPAQPPVEQGAWSENPLDTFVLARLEQSQLAPSPPADRRTLIRRLSFDLLGLPPTPAEIAAFESDARADAYALLVDRLLASPRYGERWARHWLDVAHFGESDGFEFDRMRPNAWRYRDWVIAAFNSDLPYDRFAQQQIAGDVLAPGDAAGLAATGFLVAGAHDSLLPQGEAMRSIMRQDELEDVVGIVSQSFLGMTVNCARCHDHKFDPIPQTDYYRLASALAGVRRGDRGLPAGESAPWLAERQQQLQRQLSALEDPARQTILARRAEKQKQGPEAPLPIARWNFDEDGRDELGKLNATLHDNARIVEGALVLDGVRSFAATPPLAVDLREKTLEAWVQLGHLQQRGGGVVTVQTLDGSVFDSLVFGERDPGQWLAGSDFFRRTTPLQGPPETAADKRPVHIALVYAADGRITAYREGQPYGSAYTSPAAATFKAGESQVVFGLRHAPAGGNRVLLGSIDKAQLYDRALSAEEVAVSAGVKSTQVSTEDLLAELTAEQRRAREELLVLQASVADELARWKEAKVFAITPQQPGPSHLLIRGNPLQKGEVVTPGGLVATGPAADFGLATDAGEGDRRRKLAAWISNAQNPLFARTMVNRLWHYHFGRGLVDTPNDLGFSGGEPSHRELLDWVAAELIRSGWSLKHVQRLMVTSATYQQQSLPRGEGLAVDADNRLLWRMSPRRLDAESLRDAVLTVTDELNPALGGPSFHDFRAYNRSGTQFFEARDNVGPEFHRRSIYRMWARGGRSPLLDTFDCPDPSTTSPKRSVTTTPLQALALLNNSFTLRMADAFAARLQRERPATVSEQVTLGFELAVGRRPAAVELQPSVAFAERHGMAAFCRVLLNSNAFLYVD